MRTTRRAEFKDVLFLHGWEHVHVSLNSCDCFQMCAAPCPLPLSPCFPSPAASESTGNSSPPSVRRSSASWPCWAQGCEGSVGRRSAPLWPQTPTQCFLAGTCVGAWRLPRGPSDAGAVGPHLCCAPPVPLCPSKTSQQTHTWF